LPPPSNIAIINGDTDQTPCDTGTFAITGTVGAGQAVEKTALALRDVLISFASRHLGCEPTDCQLRDDAMICGNRRISLAELHAEGVTMGDRFDVSLKAYLSPRTIGFNVHGVRVAVHRVTGEIMTLQSVHPADIGRPINPNQCGGQLDGAIAMGFGWALYEKMVYDAYGVMLNPALRDYRIPTFADVPRSEIYFADTYDKIGPRGAKAQGECAINCEINSLRKSRTIRTALPHALSPFRRMVRRAKRRKGADASRPLLKWIALTVASACSLVRCCLFASGSAA
jgi:putative selenate reductase molybdopterin-binding subunit